MISRLSIDTVVLSMSPTPWSGPWMNRQQLLSRLPAYGYKVFYSTGQWSVWDRNNSLWQKSSARGRISQMNGVWIDYPPKWLLRYPKWSSVDHCSLALGAWRLRRMVSVGNNFKFIFHVFHPQYADYVKWLRPDFLVYHAYDLYELTEGWSFPLQKKEDWLARSADICIASSDTIASRLEERTGCKFRVLANGADVAAFQDAVQKNRVAQELAAIPLPRIGYVGRINRKIDLKLIAQLARKHPEWNFILVGPVLSLDDETERAIKKCRELNNVFELGEQPHSMLPDYVAGLNVALMPYRTNANLWTSAGYPLKLHEYLAADKPVVSTPLNSILPFSEVVSLADSFEDWESAIDSALNDNNCGRLKRVEIATKNDWSCRVETLNQWFVEMLSH